MTGRVYARAMTTSEIDAVVQEVRKRLDVLDLPRGDVDSNSS
jgi:hypothetical protein